MLGWVFFVFCFFPHRSSEKSLVWTCPLGRLPLTMYSCLKRSQENAKTQLFIDTLSTFASYTVRHTVSKMWLGEERVYYLYSFPLSKGKAGMPMDLKGGTEAEAMEECCMLAYIAPPPQGTAHSGLVPSVSVFNRDIVSQTCWDQTCTDQSDEGIFSTEIPFSQMTLAFFKLKKKNQANTTFSNSSEVSLCLSAWKSWWLSLRQHNKCLINPVASF